MELRPGMIRVTTTGDRYGLRVEAWTGDAWLPLAVRGVTLKTGEDRLLRGPHTVVIEAPCNFGDP